jgi:hypothetical protein
MRAPVRSVLRGASRRSSMYLWMAENQRELAATLAELRPPDWSRIAVALANEGLQDGRGAAPTAKSAYQTWWKVRRDRKADAASAVLAAKPLRPASDTAMQPHQHGETPEAAAARRLAAFDRELKERSR